MNANLFEDLFNLIQPMFRKASTPLHKDEFFLYLLGGENNSELLKLLGNPHADDFLCGKKSLERTLGEKYTSCIEQSKTLTIDCLAGMRESKETTKKTISSALTDIKKLFQKYFLSVPEQKNAEQLLQILYYYCIRDNEKRLFASYKNQQLKPQTLRETIGRDSDAKKLHDALKKHRKVAVTGMPGCGKTRFIKYCLSQWKFDDYYYVCYNDSLKNTINKIQFRDKNGINYQNWTDTALTNNAFSSSLLVIDNFYDSPDFSQELERLQKYSVYIVVIMLKAPQHSQFYNFSLTGLTDNNSCTIFQNTTGVRLKKLVLEQILTLTRKNLLMFSLLTGQCKAELSSSTASSPEETVHKVLLNFDTDSYSTDNINSPLKFKHPYDDSNLSILGHFRSFYLTLFGNTQSTDSSTKKEVSGEKKTKKREQEKSVRKEKKTTY